MSEESIIKDISLWLDVTKFPFRIPRSFIYEWESDFWCMNPDGETREFEIKTSRQDFLIDAKKAKHLDKTKGANYFYYVCPSGLIHKTDVDKSYGLIWIDGGKLQLVKRPTKLHDRKFNDWKMLANKMYFKWYNLWRQKWLDKDITSLDDYRNAFNEILITEYEK